MLSIRFSVSLKCLSLLAATSIGFAMRVFPEPKAMDQAALEVGHITFGWTMLEGTIAEFVSHLMGVSPTSQTAHILNGNMDFRNKIQAAKGLAFLHHFDENWLATTLALLDHIDNNLRPRRNEIIHGQWFLPKKHIERRSRKTKIVRPQSFKLSLETEQITTVKISDLRTLRRDIQETWAGFLPVFFYTCDGDKLIDPSSSPTISWLRYLRLAGLGNPLRNVNSVRLRHKKASLASKRTPPRQP